MDVLASGLASQAKRQATENDLVIGSDPEGRFKDVSQRLAYLEDQATELLVTIIRQSDKTLAVSNGLTLNGGRIELSQTATGYLKQGVAETGVLNLGSEMKEVLSILVSEQKISGETIKVEAAYSTDGISFTTYAVLPLSSMPNARYWKFRITLQAIPGLPQATTKTIDQVSGLVESEKSVIEGTSLKSINAETHSMSGQTVDGTATLYSVTFTSPSEGSIGEIKFKEG